MEVDKNLRKLLQQAGKELADEIEAGLVPGTGSMVNEDNGPNCSAGWLLAFAGTAPNFGYTVFDRAGLNIGDIIGPNDSAFTKNTNIPDDVKAKSKELLIENLRNLH